MNRVPMRKKYKEQTGIWLNVWLSKIKQVVNFFFNYKF